MSSGSLFNRRPILLLLESACNPVDLLVVGIAVNG